MMSTWYYLWCTCREALVSNTYTMCQIHLSSRSEWDGLELHHPLSSSHITSKWKVIATVIEAKHSIHSQPQTSTAILCFFSDCLANLALEIGTSWRQWIVHLLWWSFPCHLTSVRKHCSSKQKETQPCCHNLSISVPPTETWKLMKVQLHHQVPSWVCFTLYYRNPSKQQQQQRTDPTQSCRGINKLFAILKRTGL